METLIVSGGALLPCGEIRLKTRREGGAGMLTAFTPDRSQKLEPGQRVQLSVAGREVFSGFLFAVEGTETGRTLIAYDQLRYLLYRDTKVFSGRTAGEIAREICAERGLLLEETPDGGYRLPSLIADNRPLLDIIRAAMEQTAAATGEKLCFYDDCGKLRMRREEEMALPLLIDGSGLISAYRFTVDIGSDTYNRVQIVRKNRRTGRREIFVREDRASIARWGTLQYCAQVAQNTSDGEIAALMDSLLSQKNRAVQGLWLQCAGDIRFRAGMTAGVSLPGEGFLGRCRILEAEHSLSDGGHQMKLRMESV